METNVDKKAEQALEINKILKLERITKSDAAVMLGVSLGTINNYIKKGLLKQIKLGTTKQSPVYLKTDDVLKLVDFEIKQNVFTRH